MRRPLYGLLSVSLLVSLFGCGHWAGVCDCQVGTDWCCYPPFEGNIKPVAHTDAPGPIAPVPLVDGHMPVVPGMIINGPTPGVPGTIINGPTPGEPLQAPRPAPNNEPPLPLPGKALPPLQSR